MIQDPSKWNEQESPMGWWSRSRPLRDRLLDITTIPAGPNGLLNPQLPPPAADLSPRWLKEIRLQSNQQPAYLWRLTSKRRVPFRAQPEDHATCWTRTRLGLSQLISWNMRTRFSQRGPESGQFELECAKTPPWGKDQTLRRSKHALWTSNNNKQCTVWCQSLKSLMW